MVARAVTKKITDLPLYSLNLNQGNILYSEGGVAYQYALKDMTDLMLAPLSVNSTPGASLVAMKNGSVNDAILFTTPLNYGGVPNDNTVDNAPFIESALNDTGYVDLGGLTWYISRPIYIPSGVILKNGKLVTLATKDGSFMSGSIFAPGNYHPVYIDPVVKTACTTSNGSCTITVASTVGYAIGDIIRLASVVGITNGVDGFIPKYMQLARVLAVSSTSLTIDSPVETSLSLVMHQANLPLYLGRFNKSLYVCTDSIIRDIEIDTWDYWTADSATYNCIFENISGHAKSVVYGNTFCRTLFNNINISFRNKACELAYGSHDTLLRKIGFRPAADWISTNSIGVSLAESGRNCVIDTFDFFLSQEATLSTIFRVSSHSGVKIRNGKIRLYSNSNNILAVEHYGGDRAECMDILYENIDISINGSAAVICDVYKQTDDAVLSNAAFKNIKYTGAVPSVALIRQRGTAANPVTYVSGTVTSDVGGSFVVSNANTFDFKLYGPITIPSLVSTATLGKLELINTNRTAAKSQNYVSESITTVTGTDITNVIKGFTYPAGSLRTSDTIQFTYAGSFGGLLGTKNAVISMVGSDATTYTIQMNATAAQQGYYSITGEVSFPSSVYCLITANIVNSGVVTASRMLVPITDLASGAFTINFIAYKSVAGDGMSVQKIKWRLFDVLS